MDLPSNLYHDSNCMGLVLYPSFLIHGYPNFILCHLNSGKSHSLDCPCQMSMANVDDQTIEFGTTLTLPYTNRSRKKKKKKTQARDQQLQQQEDDKNQNKWKSEMQQQIYSSKLLQTLSQVHLSPPPPSATATRRGRAVREAADRALAEAAKGKKKKGGAQPS